MWSISHLFVFCLGLTIGAFVFRSEVAPNCSNALLLDSHNALPFVNSAAASSTPIAPLPAPPSPCLLPPSPSPTTSASPLLPSEVPCLFRYTHISTDGLGGALNQLLNGKVTAALHGKTFCLDTPVDLTDENDWHGANNAWLRDYWDGLPRCPPEPPRTCDEAAMHAHADWQTPYVWRLWQLFYPREFLRFRGRLAQSPISLGLEHCAHVRTGDTATSLPLVPVSNVTLHLFGTPHANYDFCGSRNTCVLMNKTQLGNAKGTEFDFVNLATCAHVYACDSSFSISAKLLNARNKDYVKVARLDNTRYTELFDSSWSPAPVPPLQCSLFPVRPQEYALLYDAAGQPQG